MITSKKYFFVVDWDNILNLTWNHDVKVQDAICCTDGMLLGAYTHINYNLYTLYIYVLGFSIYIPKMKVKQSTCKTGTHIFQAPCVYLFFRTRTSLTSLFSSITHTINQCLTYLCKHFPLWMNWKHKLFHHQFDSYVKKTHILKRMK